jgi:hypothetical protein
VKLAFEVMTAVVRCGNLKNVGVLTQILSFDKAVFDCSTDPFARFFLIAIVASTVE